MVGINDELGAYLITVESRAYYAGASVSQGSHCVEEVGCVSYARLYACNCGIIVCRGVSHRNYNVGLCGNSLDSGEVSVVLLGSEGDNSDNVRVLLNEVCVGLEYVLRILRALLGLGDEGAFSVYAEYLRSVKFGSASLGHKRAASLESALDNCHINGHSGGEISGNTVTEQALRDNSKTLLACVANVLAEISVYVKLDKSGRNVAALSIDHVNACRDLGLINDSLDLVGNEQCLTEYDLIFKYDFSVFDC